MDICCKHFYVVRILTPIVSLSDHRSHTVIGDPVSSGEYGLWDRAWGRSGLLSNVLADHHLTQNRQARNIFQFVSSSKCSGPLTQNMQARILKKKKENANSTFSDEESPLYEFSARDISSKMQFEIILTMEGITPETGNTIQVFFMMAIAVVMMVRVIMVMVMMVFVMMVIVMMVRVMISMLLKMVMVLMLSSKEGIPIETGLTNYNIFLFLAKNR